MKLWDLFWRDNHGRGSVVIGQRPNAPIILWAAASLLEHAAHTAETSSVLHLIATTALAFWAVLELVAGVNYFRRTLGLIVLVVILAN